LEQWYGDYLQSGVWGRYRAALLERAEDKCEMCGAEGTLHVHHKTYCRVGGNERFEDLIVLCPTCHKRVHVLAKQRIGIWRMGLEVALIRLRQEVRDGKQSS
jgi:5-methylcytosine-specific restriction endonuclease McrA